MKAMEIEEIAQLKIFPSFEISLIRKDVKKFKGDSVFSCKLISYLISHMYLSEFKLELQESAENGELESSEEVLREFEHHMSERKLSLFRSRKEDELDIRAKELRKMAKLKQQETIMKESGYQMKF